MAATFVIVLREGFEAALLLGIVYAYLAKIGRTDSRRYVTLGAALALGASILMGVAVTVLSGPLADLGPDVIGLGVIFGAVALLTWHGWWMGRHAREMRGEVQRRIDEAHARQRVWIVGLIAFTGVFREGAETVLFLWGLLSQLEDRSGWLALGGGAAGLLGAAMLGWLVFQGGRRLSVRRFFVATSVLVLFLAAGLFSTGVGRLQGLGWLPGGDAVWDSSWLLDDHGVLGGLLGGLIGYRSRPSALELAAYVGYVALASSAGAPAAVSSSSRRRPSRRRRRRRQPVRPSADAGSVPAAAPRRHRPPRPARRAGTSRSRRRSAPDPRTACSPAPRATPRRAP
jgi:high-affinity iron transporter